MEEIHEEDIKEFLNDKQIISYIRKFSSTKPYSGYFFLLEGKSDVFFFKDIINPSECMLLLTKGRGTIEKVLQGLDELPESVAKQIIGIIDTDNDHFTKKWFFHDNVVYTDTRDLETLLLSSGAFESFIKKCINKNNYLKCTYSDHPPGYVFFQDIIIGKTQYIGLIRVINDLFSHNLFIKDIHKSLITRPEDTPSLDDVILEVVGSDPLNKKDIIEKLWSESKEHWKFLDEPWYLCRGHDLIHALITYLKDKTWVNERTVLKEKEITEELVKQFHLLDLFKKTVMFTTLLKKVRDNTSEVFIPYQYKKTEIHKRRDTGYNRTIIKNFSMNYSANPPGK